MLALSAACLPSVATALPVGAAAPAKSVDAAKGALKRVLLRERIRSAGVYDVAVTITTHPPASDVVMLKIATVARRATTARQTHRAIVRQQVTIRGHWLAIRASAANASPTISVSWRRVNALPTSSRASTIPASSVAPTGAATALGSTGSTGAAGPPGAAEVGINVAATSGDYFTSAAVLAEIDASNPAWVRVFLGWNAIEPQQGVYNVADIENYQHFFASLPAGTKIDVDVEGTPPWAAGGSTGISTPPVDDADYAAFLNYLVNAFQGRVTAWEIWNEEDSTAWWTGTPAQYAALLKTAYPAIKSADPSATVILGGLTGNDSSYLSELYADGAQGSFDAVGVHTDTGCNITSPEVFEYNLGTQTVNQYFFLGFTAIHAAMAAAGDAAKPIYMTELGWSSTTAECETGAWASQKLAGVTEQTQATYLQQAYHCLAQPQYSYVKVAMWFDLFNDTTSTAPLDNFGLLNTDYSPKPAFAAFEQESLYGDQLTGPCG